ADLQSVEKQIDKLGGKARSGDKSTKESLEVLTKIKSGLAQGKPVRSLGLPGSVSKPFGLLTDKPVLYVGNTDESPNGTSQTALKEISAKQAAGFVSLCGKIEAEILEIPESERPAFMEELGLKQTGLERVIVEAQ